MRQPLFTAILVGSAIAGILSEVMLFRMFRPPDVSSGLLGGLWVAMPFLVAAGVGLLMRRSQPTLIVLLVSLGIAGSVGVSLLNATATQLENAEREARDAVQPGEDPHSGPGGMRKSGAEAGVAMSSAFSILIVLIAPPVQVAVVTIPTLLGYGITALVRRRESPNGEPGVVQG